GHYRIVRLGRRRRQDPIWDFAFANNRARLSMEIIGNVLCRKGPVGCCSPLVAGSVRLSNSSHHVIANLRLTLNAVVDALQVMVEPSNDMVFHREASVLRIREVPHDVHVLESTMEPRTNQQLLPAARIFAAEVLAANITVDRANAHEVVPTPDRKTRDVHL